MENNSKSLREIMEEVFGSGTLKKELNEEEATIKNAVEEALESKFPDLDVKLVGPLSLEDLKNLSEKNEKEEKKKNASEDEVRSFLSSVGITDEKFVKGFLEFYEKTKNSKTGRFSVDAAENELAKRYFSAIREVFAKEVAEQEALWTLWKKEIYDGKNFFWESSIFKYLENCSENAQEINAKRNSVVKLSAVYLSRNKCYQDLKKEMSDAQMIIQALSFDDSGIRESLGSLQSLIMKNDELQRAIIALISKAEHLKSANIFNGRYWHIISAMTEMEEQLRDDDKDDMSLEIAANIARKAIWEGVIK